MVAPNVLFLVHGIGEHRGGWSQLPKTCLRDAASQYDCFDASPDPLEHQIQFVEIRYDDIFDLILSRFQGLTEQFKRLDPGLVPNLLSKVNDILSKPDSVAARYAGDVLLYQFKLVSTTVLLRVMQTITDTVSRIGRVHDGQVVKYGILGHSMGTTVVHDALQLLATQPMLTTDAILAELRQSIPELADAYVQNFGNNPFSDANFQFDAVYMVSNTSRLLHTTELGPYESRVRPFNLQNAQAVCRSFYNIEHQWDPVSKVKQFRLADAWSGNTDGAAQVDVDHVYQANVHALDHYLLNPKVHAAIFFQMAPAFKLQHLQQAQQRVDNGDFKRWGPGFEPAAVKQALQDKLEAKVQDALGSDKAEKLQEILKQLKQLL
ncbi:MAG: hypothetical protein GC149_12295 [Gammaproteobacteria bacterium]|nr:hypothetical protein [Gammaproteobacteria bacterium]